MPTLSRPLMFAAVALIAAAGGCGQDLLTYAKDARAQGMTLYAQGDYTGAAAAFASATRQDPRDYQSYYYLGASDQALGSYQQAIGAYRSGLGVMPLTLAGQQDVTIHDQSLDGLAQCIAKTGTGSDEAAALDRRAAANPNVEDLWLVAKIDRYAGDADAAIEAYTKAVRIDPRRFDVAKEAGLYEEGLGQADQASRTLKAAYADNPDDEQVNAALRRLGVVLGPSLRDERTLSHI